MRMRTLGIAIVAMLVVVAGAVLYVSSSLDRYRPEIQSQLQQKLNRPVTLGHLSLKLLPLEIKMDGFSIGEAVGFPQDRPFAAASTVFVSASLFSLLRGSPEVNDLTLNKAQIELVKNAAGVWNFSSLGKSGAPGGGPSQFSLNSLEIKDGQVGYTDLAKHEPRLVYDHIDFELSDFAPNKQCGVNLGVHFPGAGQQMLEFKGKVGPLTTATENALPPMTGHLSLEQISLAAVNRFASGTLPADTDSMASGEADVTTLADVLSCKGTLKLEDTILNGAKLAYPITATYNLEDDLKQKKLFVRAGALQLGPTSFSAAGSVDNAPTPAILNVELKTDNSSITELAKLTGALGVGFSPAYQVAGKVSVDVTAKGAATAPQLSGSITARGLQASGGEIKQPVSIPEIDLSLSPASIMSNTFTANSGGTSLSLSFTLLEYTTKNMAIDATVKTDRANVSELLNIAKTYGVEAARGMTGEGQLSLDVHVKGPTANPQALAVAGTASIMNTIIATPALRKPVSIASANAAFSQNSVTLNNLAATVGATTVRGGLSAKNFAAPQLSFNLSADTIDSAELENLPVPRAATGAKPRNGAAPGPSLLNLTTGTGSLAAGVIKANDLVLKNVSTKVQLDRGVITLSPLSAEIFGGKAAGTLTADIRPAEAQCAEKVKFAGVDANSLLSAVSSVKNTVYGSLAAETNLRFALVAGNDLARTLNGAITFNLTNGVIKNLNIMNEVEKVGRFLKSTGQDSASDGGTALKKFSGTLNLVNGVASTDNLTGVLNAGTISANGTVSLVSQEINMHMSAVLSSATSQSVGGSGIGGFMNTALANSKGELVVPVIVTGSLSHPIVTPDAAAIAKMKLGNLLPSTAGILGQGNKGLGGVLNGILGGQQNPANPKAKQQQTNPLGSILDQFKKQKPQ